MTMSILPIMSQAAASVLEKRAIQAKSAAFPLVSQIAVEPIEPSFARWLRLIDRAGRTKPAQAVNAYATAVWSRFVAWQMRRATRTILSALDDRTLADLGVRRSDIDGLLRDIEARKARWNVNP